MEKIKIEIIKWFTPNSKISRVGIMIAIQVAFGLTLWFTSKNPIFPNPMEILSSLGHLIKTGGLLQDIGTSTLLSFKAMIFTIILGLSISYLTVMPFFRPLAFVISKLRFLTLVGLSFFFMMVFRDSYNTKLAMLVFGMTVFFVTSMVNVIISIPKTEFNHARTLKMSEWQVVWQVIILGKLDHVFEVIRQNFAISWMMLTMVEAIARSEGGIGVLLMNQNKYLHLDAVYAIQFMILFIGIFQDWAFGELKKIVCPYSELTIEKR